MKKAGLAGRQGKTPRPPRRAEVGIRGELVPPGRRGRNTRVPRRARPRREDGVTVGELR